MKKLILSLTAWGVVALAALLFTGCNDDSEEIDRQERLVSHVAVPTELEAVQGMTLEIAGRGFEDGDKLTLRAQDGTEYDVTMLSVAPRLLTIEIPQTLVDGTYTFLLSRNGERQSIGASNIDVKLVVGVEMPETFAAHWQGEYELSARYAFRAGDRLFIVQNGQEYEAEVTSADVGTIRFTMPVEIETGTGEFILRRGSEEQNLGQTKLQLTFAVEVPERDGYSIRGCVFSGKSGLEGVLVSDGDLIVETDENGFYYLPSQKRMGYVFVILPSGYDVATIAALPQFWASTEADAATSERHDFELFPSDNDNHTMLVATDIHLANRNSPKDSEQFKKGFAKEIIDTYKGAQQKVYCLNLGDFAWDAYWYDNKWCFPECKNAIKDLPVQYWSTMGNHDNDPYCAGDFVAEKRYHDDMGPSYYSMNIGKIHYIMLDNNVYINRGGAQGVIGDREYYRRLTDEQLAWLREDLSHVDKSTPIMVGMHCPAYYWGYAGGKLTRGVSFETTADADNLVSCFDGFDYVQILSGHTHVNRNIPIPGHATTMMEQNLAAVCATWWWSSRYSGMNICTDGSPAGYKVFDVNGTDIKWRYKSVGLDDNRQFITYDMNEVTKHWAEDATAQKAFEYLPAREYDYNGIAANTVYINVWAHEPDAWSITVTENGVELPVTQVWKRDPMHAICYDFPRAAADKNSTFSFQSGYVPHLFSVTASSADSTLEIEVTDRFGRTYTETMTRPKAFGKSFE